MSEKSSNEPNDNADHELIIRYAFGEVFNENKKKIFEERLQSNPWMQDFIKNIQMVAERRKITSPEDYIRFAEKTTNRYK